MDRKVRDSEFVLVACTETYEKRASGRDEAGVGLGAKWESGIIISDLYHFEGNNLKFIPVIFDYTDRLFIPRPLRDTTYYHLGKAAGYEALYRRLTGQPSIEKPPLGKVRRLERERLAPLPEKSVKSTPSMLLVSPIDEELWQNAEWKAVAYGRKRGSVPLLSFGFKNELAARKIFQGWRERFGTVDDESELRIAVIEGQIAGQAGTYTVHITADPKAVRKRLEKQGVRLEDHTVISGSRFLRIKADDDALSNFQADFAEHKHCYLAPSLLFEGQGAGKIFTDLALRVSNVVFREASDISQRDLDYGVIEGPPNRAA